MLGSVGAGLASPLGESVGVRLSGGAVGESVGDALSAVGALGLSLSGSGAASGSAGAATGAEFAGGALVVCPSISNSGRRAGSEFCCEAYPTVFLLSAGEIMSRMNRRLSPNDKKVILPMQRGIHSTLYAWM